MIRRQSALFPVACVLLLSPGMLIAVPGDIAPASTHGLQAELRLRDVAPAFQGDGETSASLSLRPWVLWRPAERDLFGATLKLYANSQDGTDIYATSRETDQQYAEVVELWYQRDSATLPLGYLRAGIQPVSDRASGLWWNGQITGVSWQFDSTLVDASIGLGTRSSWLRTDTDVNSPESETAWLIFGQYRYRWHLDHALAVRAAWRDDPDPGQDIGDVLSRADLVSNPMQAVWLAAQVDGEFRTLMDKGWPRYLVEVGFVSGQVDSYSTGTVPGTGEKVMLNGEQHANLDGAMARLEFQYVLDRHARWRLGAGWLRAEGGGRVDRVGFRSTGLESNRGDLYGTSVRGHVNGESMRLAMQNIDVFNVHAAWSLGITQDLLLVVRDAHRHLPDDEINLGGTLIAPTGHGQIGQSIDLGYAWRSPVLLQDGPLQRSGFRGHRVTATASWFDPAFPDPARTVSGWVGNLEYLYAF